MNQRPFEFQSEMQKENEHEKINESVNNDSSMKPRELNYKKGKFVLESFLSKNKLNQPEDEKQ